MQGSRSKPIGLNSDNTRTANLQAQWLEGELRKEGVPTFLVWHHPPYTVSSFHRWDEKAPFQTRMRSMIQRYQDKISAVIVGHDHIGAFYSMGKVPMILSGAVWESRSPENENYTAEEPVEVLSKWLYPNKQNRIKTGIESA